VRLGDLVESSGIFWLVVRYDPKRTKTATLLSDTGTRVDLPFNAQVRVIANPGEDWPFVASPVKPTWGPIQRLVVPHQERELRLYEDWIPSEPERAGGSLFFNPKAGLQGGDLLLATHKNGKASSIVIQAGFGTVKQKQAKMASKPKPVRNMFTVILDDELDGDE
jgi:hypothetical protein